MWLASLFGGALLLVGSNAFGFECTGVKLPSNVVICSDTELTRLADERQAAINEMRSRIGEDNWPAFWENQKAWVRSYAAACGVPPNDPPPIPIPDTVRECFKRAALARIGYVRAYSPAGGGNQSVQAPTVNRDTLSPPIPVADEVALEFTSGIYVVPVLINGVLPLRFTVDSGAADVSLPADVFLTLVRTGTIGREDYIGTAKYRLADGSVVDSGRFYIHELKVGSETVKNVAASIENVKSTPLLGQSFLSKFASWSMNNERHALALVPRASSTSPETNLSRKFPAVTQPESLASSFTAPPRRFAESRDSLFCGKRVNYVVQRSNASRDVPFLGAWTGTWNNPTHLCAGLIVEETSGDGGVRALYYFGFGDAMHSKMLNGQQTSDSISFRDDEGSIFEFTPAGDNLNAKFSGKSGTLTSSFHRPYSSIIQ